MMKVIVDKGSITGATPTRFVQEFDISANVYLYCTKIMKVVISLPHLKALIWHSVLSLSNQSIFVISRGAS
ncbi:hypothetical protein [Pseudomonas cerasi]